MKQNNETQILWLPHPDNILYWKICYAGPDYHIVGWYKFNNNNTLSVYLATPTITQISLAKEDIELGKKLIETYSKHLLEEIN